MKKQLTDLIKENKGILRQLITLNNEMKELRGRVRKLEQKDSYYSIQEEIKNIKVGGTD